MVRILAGLVVAAVTCVAAPSAWACSPCSTGDPTLTVTGVEKPYAGRLRMGAQFQHRTETTGESGVDAISSAEQRLDLSVAYAVLDWLFVAAKIPLVHRRAKYVNLAVDDVMSLGDAELLTKAFIYQDRSLASRHVLAMSAGVGLPTAPIFRDDFDRPLSLEAQAGTGALRALTGVSYGFFADPISLYTSANLVIPVAHRTSTHTGRVALLSIAAQYQPYEHLALRASVDARVEQSLVEDGETDPHSGGFASFVSPELVIAPVEDLVVRLVVQIPAYRRMNGINDEGISLIAGMAYDFE